MVGITLRLSAPNHWRIEHLLDRVTLRPADLLDQLSLIRAINDVQPHEIYNLAAMSFVPASWDQPMLTGEYNAQGVTRVLEFARALTIASCEAIDHVLREIGDLGEVSGWSSRSHRPASD